MSNVQFEEVIIDTDTDPFIEISIGEGGAKVKLTFTFEGEIAEALHSDDDEHTVRGDIVREITQAVLTHLG